VHGFQGNQMRDLQHDLFLIEIVYADAAGIVAAVPASMATIVMGWLMPHALMRLTIRSPQAKRAHRVNRSPLRVYYTMTPRAEGNQHNLFSFEVNRDAHDPASSLRNTEST
jgi:hypothetical protein